MSSNPATETSAKKEQILLESGTNELEVLVFELGGQRFGVNVAKVREVILHVDATPTPGQADTVKGVIRLRGSVLMVVDLHKHLKHKPVVQNEQDWKIIVTEFNGVTAAFEVEAVDSIYRMSWQDVRPVPDSGAGSTNAVTGIAEVGEDMVMMLDFESIYDGVTARKTDTTAKENRLNVDRSKARIWLAEDSDFIRASIERMLSGSGFTSIKPHRNGAEAWQAFEQAIKAGEPLPHVLISDIEMPQMDGLHLCKRVKSTRELEAVRVVLYSSLITPETRHKGEQVGADEQFNKPKLSDAIEKIDQWIADRDAAKTAA